MVDKKAKKRLEVIQKRLQSLRQKLAGARQQPDEPGEAERLAEEIDKLETEARSLREK